MTPNQYQEAALAKEADQTVIRQRVYNSGTTATRLENGLRGLTNEVGEIADIVKGWLEYGKPLNTVGLLEECGDVLWRTCQILRAVGMTMEQAMEANLAKLGIRYKDRCTDAEAANRNTEAELAAVATSAKQCNRCDGTGIFRWQEKDGPEEFHLACTSCDGTGARNPQATKNPS